MKNIHQKLYVKTNDLSVIEHDVNAKSAYTFFSNREEGTSEISVVISLPEVFKNIQEDVIDLIVEGLRPDLENKELETKKEEVKALLRKSGG